MYDAIEIAPACDSFSHSSSNTEGISHVALVEETPNRPSSITLGLVEVLPGARALLVNGAPVDLGSRAFDVLMALLDAQGQVVSKEAIMKQVWPTTTVEETNLRVQLSCLRRALGDERWRIKTIPGRGYFLVADAAIAPSQASGQAHPASPASTGSNDAAVVIIDDACEIGDLLRRMLVSAGARIESLASLTASFVNQADVRAHRGGGPVYAIERPRAI